MFEREWNTMIKLTDEFFLVEGSWEYEDCDSKEKKKFVNYRLASLSALRNNIYFDDIKELKELTTALEKFVNDYE